MGSEMCIRDSHITALQAAGIATLNEDDAVSYDLEEGRDGRSAAGNLKLM